MVQKGESVLRMINVDWSTIRPVDGSQQKGFEELCVQLARLEISPNSQFYRPGIPDGGAECYVILDNGDEWAWQAKYFIGMSDKQWPQIDKSIKTVLEKHPRLIRYYVCIPWDLPDGRIENRQSAKERWDVHVIKWKGWASKRGMNVEYIYWGSSELIDRISKPEFISKFRFWFDKRIFDNMWFETRLEEAIRAAGPRYTPEIDVNLQISDEFEAFGRTEHFFNNLKSNGRFIREKIRKFDYNNSKIVDSNLEPLLSKFVVSVEDILSEIGSIEYLPVGTLPFQKITDKIDAIVSTSEEIKHVLLEKEQVYDAKTSENTDDATSNKYRHNPYRENRSYLRALVDALQRTRQSIAHGNSVANNPLLLLKGKAGTGKTHLLCDVTRKRITANHPTILLMGQRFLSTDEPWKQALQQLDLADISVEDFIGALESAAQVANCRALVIVDAVNEGKGRMIWPSHLAAFLAPLQRTEWIGVIISVRSSYEEIIVPEEVRSQSINLTHEGFSGNEYNAMKTFFIHYNIELPSTPLLAPEFRNPLFLKTICRGLKAKGEHRFPRGFYGISAIFDLYITYINKHLADTLNFNPKNPLVFRALEQFIKESNKFGENWLPLSRAEEIINDLLPGRDEFERSLYHGLVTEGIFIEEIVNHHDSALIEDVVLISYERFADHLIAKRLLDTHLSITDPASAFAVDAPLSFLHDVKQYVSPGLLEALCIQIPERTGKELILLDPQIITTRWRIGNAFRQSLIWRDLNSFSLDTFKALKNIEHKDHRRYDTYDAFLTVASIPDHPLNANYLTHHLQKYSMPDRDAIWSTYLHDAWENQSAVDRLIYWASAVDKTNNVDDESALLCSSALAWMLTTSNRFLRDRATKALVNLLTGRIGVILQLIDRFAEVDDLYVLERIYAVAYGIAMRSHDATGLGLLAQSVFDRIFKNGEPPAHILLRDYARGVVERALYLGSCINVNPELIRPPYKSKWPNIPTEDEIKPNLPDFSKGSYDSGELEWSRNRIGWSVMSDDFAHYVIGTNSSNESSHWLSLTLEDPPWISPKERMIKLIEDFSLEEKNAWEIFDDIDKKIKHLFERTPIEFLFENIQFEGSDGNISSKPEIIEKITSERFLMEQERETALNVFRSTLSKDHSRVFELIFKDICDQKTNPPRFDLTQLQRYILWRVFDLGWTIERFGEFDRFSIISHGREASKAERIGKKYQWIAYHEITALVADHYQYYERHAHEIWNRAYYGPWQIHCRDIDPSSTLMRTIGNESIEGDSKPWWVPVDYNNWEELVESTDWVKRKDNLPPINKLLDFQNSSDGIHWFNIEGIINWRQPYPADYDSFDIERRDLVYIIKSYLIRNEDVEIFKTWTAGIDFYSRRMPEPPQFNKIFLGEFGWSTAAQYFQQQYNNDYGDEKWIKCDYDCPIRLMQITVKYLAESGLFDCSIDDTISLALPRSHIVQSIGLKWSGNAIDFIDANGNLVVFDPSVYNNGPSVVLFREDIFKEFLSRENLTVCWIVTGEKRILGPGFSSRKWELLRISGSFIFGDKGPEGSLTYKFEENN